jgi:hypothetical protein
MHLNLPNSLSVYVCWFMITWALPMYCGLGIDWLSHHSSSNCLGVQQSRHWFGPDLNWQHFNYSNSFKQIYFLINKQPSFYCRPVNSGSVYCLNLTSSIIHDYQHFYKRSTIVQRTNTDSRKLTCSKSQGGHRYPYDLTRICFPNQSLFHQWRHHGRSYRSPSLWHRDLCGLAEWLSTQTS